MPEELKAVWQKYQNIGALLGGAVLVLTGSAAWSPSASVEVQVARNTAAIDTLKTERRRDRQVLDFLACGQEQRINGAPEALCLKYLTGLSRGNQ